ncbi:MAG: hypothetical protein JSR80_06500 [Verrucomicrobia bacterium]|nr:hypothetical protein [Verrucomicrobiota bacterium]
MTLPLFGDGQGGVPLPPLPVYQKVPCCIPPYMGRCCEPKRCPIPEGPNPFLHPWNLRGIFLHTGRARIADEHLKNERFGFQQAEVRLGYLAPTGCLTGLAPTIGFRETDIDWKKNPYMHSRHFQELYLGAYAFTRCIDCWYWQVGLGWWQQLYRLQLGHYGMMEGLLWGRYQWWRNVGVHVGTYVEAGRRQGFVRPIIGIDWKINDRWHAYAVYPVDTKIVYQVNPAFCLALAGRPNRTRLRLEDTDPDPEGLLEYRMWGVEGRATYQPSVLFKIDTFVGSTIWSFIKVNNRWNKRIVYTNLKDTWYAGAHIYLSY